MPERHDPGSAEGGAYPPGLGELLAAAVRGDGVDPDAEGRALAAFRAARDEEVHGSAARTRRRDDWRPERRRRVGRPVRVTLVALVAGLTLGGVAVAAIGGGGARDEGAQRGRAVPASTAPDRVPTSAPDSSAPARSGAPSGRPSSDGDTEAHCRAYDSVKGRGRAVDPPAWQRLVQAAGGEKNVKAYCADRLAGTEKQKKADKGKPNRTAKPSKAPGKGATKGAKSAKSTKSK